MWSDHINYYSTMRTHQLVLEWIENQLASGELALGGRLPGERAMAEQLQVSRTSVREAVRILEAMGVVRAGVGSGKDAGTIVIAEPGSALGSTLRLHVATRHLPVPDIVETRVLLESWAAERARPGVAALDDAAELLEQMENAPDVDTFLALDSRFHVALARGGGQRRRQCHDGVPARRHRKLRRRTDGKPARLERHFGAASGGAPRHP
ncbi:GntR family transcriptional regulator [Paenarthrobacter ureafaciens]